MGVAVGRLSLCHPRVAGVSARSSHNLEISSRPFLDGTQPACMVGQNEFLAIIGLSSVVSCFSMLPLSSFRSHMPLFGEDSDVDVNGVPSVLFVAVGLLLVLLTLSCCFCAVSSVVSYALLFLLIRYKRLKRRNAVTPQERRWLDAARAAILHKDWSTDNRQEFVDEVEHVKKLIDAATTANNTVLNSHIPKLHKLLEIHQQTMDLLNAVPEGWKVALDPQDEHAINALHNLKARGFADAEVPRAAIDQLWADRVADLLARELCWSLSRRGELTRFIQYVRRMLEFGEKVAESYAAAKGRLVVLYNELAGVQQILASVPADIDTELQRLDVAIVEARKRYKITEISTPDDADAVQASRDNYRASTSRKERLLISLAELKAAGFADAPVLPPLDVRCSSMTLAMFDDIQPMNRSNHGVESATYEGRPVVLKSYSSLNEKDRRSMYNELKTLDAVSHPNVAKAIFAFSEDKLFYIVYDHYMYGSLLDWKDAMQKAGTLVEADVIFSARKIIEAVAALHAQSVIHCDIKPENVFVTGNGSPILGDFDVSKSAEGRTMTCTVAGTLEYMAPELYTRQNAEGKPPRASVVTDIYSLGLTLQKLARGVTTALDEAISQMVQADPEARPRLADLLALPIFVEDEKKAVSVVAERVALLEERRLEIEQFAVDHREKMLSEANANLRKFEAEAAELRRRRLELAEETRRIESLKEERLCAACVERVPTHAYVDCGHVCLCSVCAAKRAKRCPVCHKKSKRVCYSIRQSLVEMNLGTLQAMSQEQRADSVLAWAEENGFINTMMTAFELINDYPQAPFHGMREDLLVGALKFLGTHGLATVVCGSSFGVGVKFHRSG
ncbi:Protein kinase domain [Carpediemonas membranifera]|uniref:non-specific serine/threonine protein kinase n=1 Tax=Carpediemonas membranifera TaxID=201153 RepID=A0A8J6B4I2_9EUKA|nr:Protein kinase domain [Carpediemonas membranifera]|eukprot:KAG9389862.1 Protein kinase domain [Carpediemonas membranifera]